MKRLCAALGFLTTLPCGKMSDGITLGKSVPFFPLVGLILGGILVFFAWGLTKLGLPSLPGSILVVMGWTMVTGGIHLDGLADSADGLFSCRSRERMLEIMRDSRIGSMGALALIFQITLKTACLNAMQMTSIRFMSVLLLAPVAGRCLQVIMMTWFPYARKEGGLAQVFLEYRKPHHAITALFVLFMTSVGFLGGAGFVCAGVSMVTGVAFCFYCRGKIGGFTGDTLGAVCEISETAFLLAILFRPAG